MGLEQLLDVPESVQQANELIAGLDRCLLLGFSRLGPEQHEALDAVARVMSGTPLESRVADAVAAVKRNEFLEPNFTALGVARAAIQGAQYDALRSQAHTVLGRAETSGPSAVNGKPEASPALKNLLEAVRHWLMEVALAGFRNIEHPTLAPFFNTLEQIQGEPRLTRLSALLTGFLRELLAALPIHSPESVPVFRWADLWTRGMVGSLHVPAPSVGDRVAGKLSPLGVDLRHHGFFASADVYGLLEAGGGVRVVRVTLSSYKVDVLTGPEMWRCFGKAAESLLQALSQQRTLDVKDATLLPTGDLLWDGKATLGKPFNRIDLASRALAPDATATGILGVAPLDRHPVQIAECVFLNDVRVTGDKAPEVALADKVTLPLAMNRVSPASGLTAKDLSGATSILGLLRFDSGRWALQPLATAEAFAGQNAFEAATVVDRKKGDTLAILRERASRLLRKKS